MPEIGGSDASIPPRYPLILRLLNGAALASASGTDPERPIQKKRLALLIRLARAPQRRLSREAMLAVLWPDSAPDAGRRLLNEAVYVIRRDLGPDAVKSVGEDLVLDSRIRCDVDEFFHFLDTDRLPDAVACYSGPFLGAWYVRDSPEFSKWADDERAEITQRFQAALETLAARAEATEQWATAARFHLQRFREDSYSSRFALNAASALAKSGESAAALRTIDTHRALLREELQAALPAELIRLEEEIRRGAVVEISAVPAIAPPSREPIGLAAAPNQRVEPTRARTPIDRGRTTMVAALVMAVLVSVAALWRGTTTPELTLDGTNRRLLITPYRFVGPENMRYLATGLVDEIAARLAPLPHVQLLAPGLVPSDSATRTSLDVGRAIDADVMLEGRVTVDSQDGDRPRLSVIHTLIMVATGEVLWSWRNAVESADAYHLASAVGDSVGARLGIVLSIDTRRPADPPSRAARDLFHRGNLQQARGRSGMLAARALYDSAIRLDSNYSRALAAYVQVTAGLRNYLLERDSAQLQRAALMLDRALAIDPALAEVHLVRARWQLWIDRDMVGSLRSLDTALALRPEYVDALTQRANLRRRTHDWLGSLRDHEQALRINPLTYQTRLEYGNTLMLMHRYDEAAVQVRIAQDLQPTSIDPPAWLAAIAFRARGDTDEVTRIISDAVRRVDGRQLRTRLALSFPETMRSGTDALFATFGRPTLRDALGDTAAFLALIAERREEPASMRQAAADSAQHVLERQIAAEPSGFRAHTRLARLYLLGGDTAHAFLQLRIAREKVRPLNDAMEVADVKLAVAQAEVQGGRLDSARAHVRELLSTPSALSAAVLRVDPLWRPLSNGTRVP